MRKLLLFLLFPIITMAQDKGVVLDDATGNPLPYVNIASSLSEKATSSDEDGNFFIDFRAEDMLTFSAIGYETLKITATQSDRVRLKPIIYPLGGIIITKPKRTIEAAIGGYRRNDIGMYYGTRGQAYLYARYFAPADFSKTPFLATLVVMTDSGVKEAKFNVHFLEANPDGTPGAEMASTNIIGVARKGKRDTKIDLKPYGLRIPENGFFVALETVIVPENRYLENSYTDKNKVYHETVFYAPTFGTTRTEENTSWGFGAKHIWGKFQKVTPDRIQKYYDDFKKSTGEDAPPFDNRHIEFAMQLTLTN